MRKRSEHLFKGGFFFFFLEEGETYPDHQVSSCWRQNAAGIYIQRETESPRGSPLHTLVQPVAFFRKGWKSNRNLWQKGNILPPQADVDKGTSRGPEGSALSQPWMLWRQLVPLFPFLLVVLLGAGERREHWGQVKLTFDPGFAGTSTMTSDTGPHCFHYLMVEWDADGKAPWFLRI